MTKTRRLLLGILLGATGGAVLTSGILYALPDPYPFNFDAYTVPPFLLYCQFVLGDLFTHPSACFIVCGGIIGAITGLFLARVVPHPKICLGILIAFIVGFTISGMVLFGSSERWCEKFGAHCINNTQGNGVRMALLYLKRIDGGTTNDMALCRHYGRSVLQGYINDVDQHKTHTEAFEFSEGLYNRAQKYLATHPEN